MAAAALLTASQSAAQSRPAPNADQRGCVQRVLLPDSVWVRPLNRPDKILAQTAAGAWRPSNGQFGGGTVAFAVRGIHCGGGDTLIAQNASGYTAIILPTDAELNDQVYGINQWLLARGPARIAIGRLHSGAVLAIGQAGEFDDSIAVSQRAGDAADAKAARAAAAAEAIVERAAAAKDAAQRKVRAAAEDRRRVAETEQRRATYAKLGWSAHDIDNILQRKVTIGMTSSMVTAAWGKPTEVNRTVTAASNSEQWVYGSGDYVYVENGRVTAIQSRGTP